jgi:hypothetical protein
MGDLSLNMVVIIGQYCKYMNYNMEYNVLTLTKSLGTRDSFGLYHTPSFMFYTSDNESMNNIAMQMHLHKNYVYFVKTSKNYDASLLVSTAYT